VPKPPAYDYWFNGNYLTWAKTAELSFGAVFDLALFNPPYGKTQNEDGEEIDVKALTELFFRATWPLIVDGGYIAMLTRIAFLASTGRGRGSVHRTSQ
jgi:tRNA1(Val) A37 N6-methylase TrmN6